MKKIFVVSRATLSVGLTCALCGLAARPAQAGWQFTYSEPTGTFTETHMGNEGPEEFEAACGTSIWGGCEAVANNGLLDDYFPPGTTVIAKTNVTYTVKATWNGGGAAPEKAWFKITGFTSASGSETPTFGMDGQLGKSSPYGSEFGRIAHKIISKEGGASEYDLGSYTFTPQATTIVNYDSGNYMATTSGGVSAEVADRGVSLSRAGAVGDITKANGNVHGDTTYSHNVHNPPDPILGETTWLSENRQTILAAPGGAWTKRTDTDYMGGDDRDLESVAVSG